MLKRFIQKILLNILFTPQHRFYLMRACDLRADALRSLGTETEQEYIDRTLHDLRAKRGDEITEDIAIYQSLIDALKKFNPHASK